MKLITRRNLGIKMTKFVLFFVGCVIASSIAVPVSSDSQSNSELENGSITDGLVDQFVNGSITDGLVDQFVNHMADGLKLSNETLGQINIFQKIFDLKTQIDNKIQAITEEIGLVAAEHMKYSKLAIDAYRKVKSIIRRERNSLFQLADKTERVTEHLIFYMEGWGPEYDKAETKAYLLEQMKLLRELIDESKIVLADAKEKYELASDKMNEIDGHLSDFRRALQRLTDESSDDYHKMAQNVRGGAYGASAGLLIGMIVADVFGCLGFCSTIVGGATFGATAVTVEVKLAEAKERLNALEVKVATANNDVKEIQGQTTTLKRFIDQEIILLYKWQNAAIMVESRMTSLDGKLDVSLHRKSFTQALQGLHAIASEFSNGPTEIFKDIK